MERVYVGLDVGSTTCHLVAMDKDRTVVEDRRFDTSEANVISAFEAVGRKAKGLEVRVHLEAAELAVWIRRILRERVARVLVGHPKSSAWIAKDPLKHDRLDAYKLADLLRNDQVHEVYIPDDDHRSVFKQIVQHFDDITYQEVRLKNKIKARLRAQGVIVRGKEVFSAEGREAYLAKIKFPPARQAIEQLYGLMDVTLGARAEARRLMRQESRRYPEIALFEGVPGVGLIGACRFSAYIQTPFRFSSKRKLWRYCRLGITDRRSDGKSLGRKALDWNGIGILKLTSRVTFLAALKSCGDNAFKNFYHRALEATHNKDHARLSTQRKILTVLWTMWKRGEAYRDDKATG